MNTFTLQLRVRHFDILLGVTYARIPRITSWFFCFIATASTPKEDLVLCSLHRLAPQVLRFYKSKPTNLTMSLKDERNCLSSFSRSTDFSAPPFFYWTSLVRLSDPCVAGGSLTMYILVHKLAILHPSLFPFCQSKTSSGTESSLPAIPPHAVSLSMGSPAQTR